MEEKIVQKLNKDFEEWLKDKEKQFPMFFSTEEKVVLGMFAKNAYFEGYLRGIKMIRVDIKDAF